MAKHVELETAAAMLLSLSGPNPSSERIMQMVSTEKNAMFLEADYVSSLNKEAEGFLLEVSSTMDYLVEIQDKSDEMLTEARKMAGVELVYLKVIFDRLDPIEKKASSMEEKMCPFLKGSDDFPKD